MTRHLVIFARAPQLGCVKRRLAGGIGAMAATRFYRLTLGRQIRRMAHDRRWTVWLFVTPDTALGHPAWREIARARVRGQGPGDLGRRMKQPFRLLPPGPTVLVGSDIPAMRAHHIARAFALLARNELVFGPANDGGFWLVGARRTRALPPGLFATIRWSTAHTLADALATIPTGWPTGMADELDDVDDARDLRRLEEAVSAA